MFISGKPTPLTIVTDFRFKSDSDLDRAESDHAPHVLDFYGLGAAALTPRVYADTCRIALFEYRSEPTTLQRQLARKELRAYLLQHDVRCAVVIPTPQMDDEGAPQTAETICWHAFGAPDGLAEMRGCFFDWSDAHNYVLPAFPSSPYLKELQRWQQAEWLQRARDPQLLRSATKRIHYGADMYAALEVMGNKPIAVDIESIEATGTVTAIGISDGYYGVSVPWHDYIPYNAGVAEVGVAGTLPDIFNVRNRVADLLADSRTAKIFHNYTFDVPRLRDIGLPVAGSIHDTFAAHAIAYPELRHGLQHACASLLNITPWKSMWHPKLPGVTRDDIEYWICDPIALRDYNADDAYHTWHLARLLLPSVECGDVFRKDRVA